MAEHDLEPLAGHQLKSHSNSTARRDRPEDLGVDAKVISELIFGEQDAKVRTGFIWLRICASGGLL